MNWNCLLLQLALLFLLVVDVAVCDHQLSSTANNAVDTDIAELRAVVHDIFSAGNSAGLIGNGVMTGRTFGVKRIQFMLMPMVYKMGVIMTMLTILTVISLKGLAIGVILLVLKLSALFGKLYAGGYGHSPAVSWTPPQPVHVHLHSGGHHHSPQAYNGWDTAGGPPPHDESYYYKG